MTGRSDADGGAFASSSLISGVVSGLRFALAGGDWARARGGDAPDVEPDPSRSEPAASAGADSSPSGGMRPGCAPPMPIATGVAAPRLVAGAMAAMWLAYRM